MMKVTQQLMHRRNVLRGMMGAGAVTVSLPFLDCFLNSNGTALAATGASLPACFGTWYQGLGFNPGRWLPNKTGRDYENNIELKCFDARSVEHFGFVFERHMFATLIKIHDVFNTIIQQLLGTKHAAIMLHGLAYIVGHILYTFCTCRSFQVR